MFKTIEIEHFRGIRHAKIDGLKGVNIFFGKNNCGKSSLLDAIFLISGLSNPKLPININLLRNYQRFEPSDLALDFYTLDTSQPVKIKASNDEVRELMISLFESAASRIDLLGNENNISSTDTKNRYGLVLKCMIDGHPVESSITLSHKGVENNDYEQSVKYDSGYKENLTCRYLSPRYDIYTSLESLTEILKNKDEQFILEALRIIEPMIKDIVLSQNEVLVDVGLDKRIPINVMGDGARKILSILTTIYECRDGIVLVDEISNGFHYSVMKALWQTILLASKKNNVQLFATSHDLDSIKGLRDAALHDEGDKDRVSFFKLQRTKDAELKSYCYATDSIDYMLNQEIEIR